jgi:hypothetical protein
VEIFVSCAAADRPRIESLIKRLRESGFDVFTDSDPLGTWLPWRTIIDKLIFCTLVLAVMSKDSVNDEALRSEREYGVHEVIKPTVAVVLDRVPAELLPTGKYTKVQVVDYTQPDEEAVISAILALQKPVGKIDDPPYPPPAPLTRIDVLNSRIARPSLSHAEQEDIVSQLQEAVSLIRDPEFRQTIEEILGKLAKRPDLKPIVRLKVYWLQAQLQPQPATSFQPPAQSDPEVLLGPAFPREPAPLNRDLPDLPVKRYEDDDLRRYQWNQHRARKPKKQEATRKREKQHDYPDDAVSRAVQAAVKPGLLMFNTPTEMTQGKKERIEIGIARSPELREALTAGLRGYGTPQFELVSTSSLMGVELKGTSFEITPFSLVEQLVTPKARWEFDVRPNRAGNQTLTLCISMRVDSPAATGGRIAIPVLERDIKIHVDIGFSTRRFVTANWQWLIATAVGLGGALVAWLELFHSLSPANPA